MARERLQNPTRELHAQVFALLDVRATIVEHGKEVRVRVEGSVAHDLLLSSVTGGLSPSKLASGGKFAGCHSPEVPFSVQVLVAA